MTITPTEFREFVEIARANKVQEFSIGETHVLLSSAALVSAPPAELPGKDAPAPPPMTDDEKEVAKLMDDPDLFLHADGPNPLPT